MSDKPRQVDLGPMYLPLGQERQRPVAPAAKAVPVGRREDVDRFRELMQRSPGALASPGGVAPLSLLARRDDSDPPPCGRGEHPGLIDAMERLWVSEGLHGEREVRIGLRNRILPDTAVRMRTLEGHLQIDLSSLDGRGARQLAAQLESLAHELGSRLDRPVVATVEHVDHGLLRTASWFPGQS